MKALAIGKVSLVGAAMTAWMVGTAGAQAPAAAAAKVRKDPQTSIRGAVYVSAEAANAPQLWKNFNLAETKRDFGYAHSIHVNAFRVWASYEYWKMEPAKFQAEMDQMLKAGQAQGIRIMFALFENDGLEPTQENMFPADETKALDTKSPGKDVTGGPESGWEAPRQFVTWFMNRYKNDGRVLAVEVMNEPNEKSLGFAMSMFKTAKSLQGTVPLTLGSAHIEQAEKFIPLGLNIIQFHDNFPSGPDELAGRVKEAMALGEKTGLPVWLTEWQRIRPGGQGFSKKSGVAADEKGVDYASLAAQVHSYPIGSFFWCLMVKTAYLPGQRVNGTVNGLFWPDGAVSSLKDARAIAEDPKLDFKERAIPADFTGIQLQDGQPGK